MKVQTRSQKFAQEAYKRVMNHDKLTKDNKEYTSFAKKFPALIHTCGLAQAISFAIAKKQTDYVEDLAKVLKDGGHIEIDSIGALDERARNEPLANYLRLSRDAIQAASWLKRYVEAIGEAN